MSYTVQCNDDYLVWTNQGTSKWTKELMRARQFDSIINALDYYDIYRNKSNYNIKLSPQTHFFVIRNNWDNQWLMVYGPDFDWTKDLSEANQFNTVQKAEAWKLNMYDEGTFDSHHLDELVIEAYKVNKLQPQPQPQLEKKQ